MIRRTRYTVPGCIKIISTRSLKNFNKEEFLEDTQFLVNIYNLQLNAGVSCIASRNITKFNSSTDSLIRGACGHLSLQQTDHNMICL